MCVVCVCVWYLCQGLYTGVNVPAGHLRDDEVDGGGRAVVEFIKVWRDRMNPTKNKSRNNQSQRFIRVVLKLRVLDVLRCLERLTWVRGS